VAGKRLKGLDLSTFLREALRGRRAKTEHLDGAFYYPTRGIGMIADRLAASCGMEHIRLQSRVTKLVHAQGRITAIELNGRDRVAVQEVVSTLPMPLVFKLLDPPPDADAAQLAEGLRYRNLILVALCLNRPSLSRDGSIYFPDAEIPFTRLYEPKNRSAAMAPPHQTSAVVELPCQADDAAWALEDDELVELVSAHLERIGLLRRVEIADAVVRRISHAYPILEVSFERRVAQLSAHLSGFANLKLAGRSGLFEYTHIHDLIRLGKELADSFHAQRQDDEQATPADETAALFAP